MPNKHGTGARSTVIRCPNCGEDYSVTYKRCPFCDEKTAPAKKRAAYEDSPDTEYDDTEEGGEASRHSGRRLYGGTARGGGWPPLRIVSTVVSLAIIVAAIWIVATQIIPLVKRANPDDPAAATPTPPSVSQDVGGITPPTDSGTPDPNATTPPATSLIPEVSPTPAIPAGQTATGFTMSKSDVSLSRYGESFTLKITYTPSGSTGSVTFESDKPEVAVVGADGVVTGKSRGTATITATLPGGVTQECIVRCKFDAPAGSGGGSSQTVNANSGTGSLSLNKTDFTFTSLNDPAVQMKVSGTSSTPVWSIGDSSVATISETGLVKPVSKGNTTITCTVDGKTLECIVRCSF